ncbi:hypothetical protein TURU_023986 [Turdus rufiventris]|nr:hypothetical protein TURU_023986 [Turdus rufiventris]
MPGLRFPAPPGKTGNCHPPDRDPPVTSVGLATVATCVAALPPRASIPTRGTDGNLGFWGAIPAVPAVRIPREAAVPGGGSETGSGDPKVSPGQARSREQSRVSRADLRDSRQP